MNKEFIVGLGKKDKLAILGKIRTKEEILCRVKEGGYEVNCGPWSKLGPESFDKIIEIFEKLNKI